MSSDRRPWFPWYPRDFGQDEKVRALSDDAELVYRRTLDVMWQANDLHLPCNCRTLANQVARGWTKERFKEAWDELMMPGFELLKTTEDGKKVYSERLKREALKIEKLSKKRAVAALAKHKQSKCTANAQHMQCHTDTDTDIKERSTSVDTKKSQPAKKRPPKKNPSPPTREQVRKYFSSNGYTQDTADRFFSCYANGNPPWHDTRGNPVLAWKQKAHAVWFKDENKVGLQNQRAPTEHERKRAAARASSEAYLAIKQQGGYDGPETTDNGGTDTAKRLPDGERRAGND